MKVALYARVSLDEDADDKRFQDPENQLVPLRNLAKALEYEIVEEYVDFKSGGDPNRPNFRRMMQDAMLRRFEGIMVWNSDRFSREGVLSTMAYVKQLKTRKVFLKSLTEAWLDTGDESMAELILAIMAWAAGSERKKISWRTKAGIAQKRAIGQWRGGRPKKGEGGKRSSDPARDGKGPFSTPPPSEVSDSTPPT